MTLKYITCMNAYDILLHGIFCLTYYGVDGVSFYFFGLDAELCSNRLLFFVMDGFFFFFLGLRRDDPTDI